MFPANRQQKEAGVATLVLDKIDFETKMVIKDKDEHHIRIRYSIQWEDITFVNVYSLNIEVSKYIKQVLTDLNGKF